MLLLGSIALLSACASGDKKPMETPKDRLVATLFSHVEKGEILYGHQDDLSYGHAWKVEDWTTDSLTRSDVKAVTGRYPAIVGFDLGGIEMGDKANLDSVDFGLIRKAALTHVERGGIVTFSRSPGIRGIRTPAVMPGTSPPTRSSSPSWRGASTTISSWTSG